MESCVPCERARSEIHHCLGGGAAPAYELSARRIELTSIDYPKVERGLAVNSLQIAKMKLGRLPRRVLRLCHCRLSGNKKPAPIMAAGRIQDAIRAGVETTYSA
jgi:hypothetical protein